MRPNLVRAKLSEADLRGADLHGADLTEADLGATNLEGANLEGAVLTLAYCIKSSLAGAKLRDANLKALLGIGCSLRGADLTGSDLTGAHLVEADLSQADLSGASVYGCSVWDTDLSDAIQRDLVITPRDKPPVTVDNLQMAQFIYLILDNRRLQDSLTTIGKKAVLILGRFVPDERKQVLETLRAALQRHDLLPIVFDFPRPEDRDWTETVTLLAGMSRFIIADVTSPRSSPLELQATVPNFMIPLVAIFDSSEEQGPFAMFRDLYNKYPWVLDPLAYRRPDELSTVFKPAILDPAEALLATLVTRKERTLRTRATEDYLLPCPMRLRPISKLLCCPGRE